jgi:hypothetical protein
MKRCMSKTPSVFNMVGAIFPPASALTRPILRVTSLCWDDYWFNTED